MKNFKHFIYLLVAVVTFSSCDFQKVSDLQDDFTISVEAEPIKSNVSLKVFDAADGSEVDGNVSIALDGLNSDKVYTISGSKSLSIESSFLILGVNRNFDVSVENPLVVTASVSAPGYLTKTREITFDGTEIREEQISLLKEDNLPETIILESETQTLSNNKTTAPIEVSITSNNNSEEVTEFTVPAGTSFEDENGNPITGSSVTADFQTFDSEIPDENEPVDLSTQNPETFSGGNNDFPGGLSIDGASVAKGNTKYINVSAKNSLVQSYLIPITNLWCFYLYVDGKKVYRFSEPTVVRNYIFRNATNPETGNPVADGDEVSVYYYNRTTSQREKLSNATVSSDSKGKYVEFTAPRAGVYPIGFEKSFDHSCTSISSVKFQNDGRRSYFFYAISPKSNPSRALRYGYMYFEGTYEVNDANLNFWGNQALNYLGEDMILKVYNYSYDSGRYEVVYNEEISICELDGQTINISNSDCFTTRDIDVTLECTDATYILNNVYVYYRNESDYWWKYYDLVDGGLLNGKSPCFIDGERYKFGFYYDGWRETEYLTAAQIEALFENFDVDAICNSI